MALKKAIVIGADGEFEELQVGDTLDGPIAEVDVVSMTNDNAAAITQGQPVYVSGSLAVDEAQANAGGTTEVIGLVRDASIAAAAVGSIQTDGILDVADWTLVIGAAALVVGTVYWLSAAAPGQLTSTPPTGNPNRLVRVGTAISTTSLEISISSPVLRG
jgi:hypothetical protein